MRKTNTRLELARAAYREALEAARMEPSPEAWARLLAAGKDLSAAQEPRSKGRQRSRQASVPSSRDLETEQLPEVDRFD